MPTDAQLKRLFALSRKAGLSPDELKQTVADRYGHESRRDLTDREYEELCLHLQEYAGERSVASGRLKPGELAKSVDKKDMMTQLRAAGLLRDNPKAD